MKTQERTESADTELHGFEQTDDLVAELRQLDSATDGCVVDGYITDVSKTSSAKGTLIAITVETPLNEFSQSFEKPKPPLAGHDITRVAEEYGVGLVDISALEGQRVPCVYENGSWEMVVPDPPLHSRVSQLKQDFSFKNIGDVKDWKFIFALGPIFIPIFMLMKLVEPGDADYIDGVAIAAWSTLFWILITVITILFL